VTRPKQTIEAETLDRVRRVETRLTQLMIQLGVETQRQKPEFNPLRSEVKVPSPHSSLQEILDSLPKEWQDPIGVCINGRPVFYIDQSP
jgi:hypothetical protein